MFKTANLIAVFLFGLGEIMLFFANRYDPINASILMLAMLLLALSTLRLLFVPFAPATNRLGSIGMSLGFFMLAFFYFDITALGLSAHSMHFSKTLFWFPQILLICGSVLLAIWLYPLGKQNRFLGSTLPVAIIAYAASRILSFDVSVQLLTAIILGAALCWLAVYEVKKF